MSTNKLLIDDRLHNYRRDKYRARGVREIFPWLAGGGWPVIAILSRDKMPLIKMSRDKMPHDKMSRDRMPFFF
ncbi:unnamed protein product [Meloidogyne enterolobii]|uniref:Uncharacterized protein n=1 Tax=Meloidogyne enterolobii TaxID=390850 RepID=A0ACB0ZQ54_MELEN